MYNNFKLSRKDSIADDDGCFRGNELICQEQTTQGSLTDNVSYIWLREELVVMYCTLMLGRFKPDPALSYIK